MNRVTHHNCQNERHSTAAVQSGAVVTLAWWLWMVSGSLHGQDLPAGTVERAIQATVKPAQLEIIYDFGLNPATVQQLWMTGGHQPISDEVALAEAFVSWWSQRIVSHLAVHLDDHICQPSHWETELIYQHHLQFRCRLVYSLPPRVVPQRLEIRDDGFANWPGHFRVAIRGKPPELVQWSDAAAIIARAARRATERLGPGNVVLPRIEARLAPDPSAAAILGDSLTENRPTVTSQQPGQPGDSLPGASSSPTSGTAPEPNRSQAAGVPKDHHFQPADKSNPPTDNGPNHPWWVWGLLAALGICCAWISWAFIRK